ncbi:MAG: hypothetical protein ACRC1H_12080 [Caldilineaceae bacterium]
MEWLNLEWISANWMPLAVAVGIGFLLGWLFTGAPAGRRAKEAEARSADVESRLRKSDRDLVDAKREVESQRARLQNSGDDLEKARARIAALETSVASLTEDKAALEKSAAEAAAAVAASQQSELDAGDDVESPTPAEMAAGFAAVARLPDSPVAPSSKDIALDEAFSRAATLQREVEERDVILSMRQAEMETLKSELLTSNAARRELEARLVRAREDVAAELAVLASTMIKMKDDALARAEARHAALQAETELLRAAAERATQTAD